MIQCKNCKHQFEGNFCPNCGQKYIDKFTWRYTIELFMRSIEFERGLFYNIKELLLRPGQTVKQYINGRTKPYLNAVTFFVIGFSFYGIATWLVYDVGLETYTNTNTDMIVGSIFITAFVCYIPIAFSVCRGKYSLLESCLISFFLFGEISLLFTFITLMCQLIHRSLSPIWRYKIALLS